MNEDSESETAGAATPTASESQENPPVSGNDETHQVVGEEPNAGRPSGGGSDDTKSAVETDNVAPSKSPAANKRGRGRRAANGSQPAGEVAGTQANPIKEWIASAIPLSPVQVKITDLVLRAPFSTLLQIEDQTYASILDDMKNNGCDGSQPVHIWDGPEANVLVDGFTRVKAATELGIEKIPAFIHRFANEDEALTFAIKTQIHRRNIRDGQLALLIKTYDKNIKRGSTQARLAGGKFAPKASTDAHGKSAAKTAEQLNTSTTKIERTRFVFRHAPPEIKNALLNNKVTLNKAWERTQKRLEAEQKSGKKEKTSNKKYQAVESFPFTVLTDSTLAFGVWIPVHREVPEPSDDPAADADAPAKVKYVVDQQKLAIAPSAKILKTLSSRRVLVSPNFDLFADEVPAEIIRQVLRAAGDAGEIQFLFTTTNPARLAEFTWHMNMFAGVSIFAQRDIEAAEEAMTTLNGPTKFIVVEQLTAPLTFAHLDGFAWLVVRNRTGMANPSPNSPVIKSLLQQAWQANIPVLFDSGIAYAPADVPPPPTDAPAAPANSGERGTPLAPLTTPPAAPTTAPEAEKEDGHE